MSSEVDAPIKPAASDKKSGFSNRYITILVTVSSAVGFGNIWRFPYLVYQHGGLGFIIIYLITLVIVGIPILVLESGVGQVSRGGQNVSWTYFGRYCRSPGWSAWTSGTICCYYTLLLAWSFLFFVSSFRTFGWENPASWQTECQGYLDVTACTEMGYCQWRGVNGCIVDPLFNTRVFFRDTMNAYSEFNGRDASIGVTGLSYKTFLAYFFSCVFVALCIIAGARIFSYTTYFTMIVPSILLVVLVVLTSTFEGAKDGIVDYIGKFKSEAFTVRSAVDALTQCFFSLSIAQGAISALASHGKKDDNFVENSVTVAVMDTFFAIFAGFAVFGMVGFLSSQSKLPISELPISGIALAFTAYPSAMAQIGGVLANVTSVIFFFTLWLIGASTLCTLYETVIVTIISSRVGIYLRINRWKATVGYTAFMILLPGLLFSTQAGFALLDAMDNYSAMAQVFVGGMQAVCIGWLYLQDYSKNKVGKTAVLIHGVTFFIGPILLGLLGEVEYISGIILGFGIPIVGFFVAVYFCNKTDNFGKLLTFRKKAYFLGDYNVQALRKVFNNTIEGSGYLKVPRAWNFCIKYIVPFCTLYLFFSGLVTPEKMYKRPSAENPYPWYIFLISQISPVLMVVVTVLTLAFPSVMTPLLPPNAEFAKYRMGEEEIKQMDYDSVSAAKLEDSVKV